MNTVSKNGRTLEIFVLLSLSISAALLVIVSGLFIRFNVNISSTNGTNGLHDFSTGWFMSTAEGDTPIASLADLDIVGDGVVIWRDVAEDDAPEVLTFTCDNLYVTALADDTVIYDLTTSKATNGHLVNECCLITLPTDTDGYRLTLTLSKSGEGHTHIDEFLAGFHYAAMLKILVAERTTFICIVLMGISSVFLLLAFTVFHIKKHCDMRVLCLSMFLIGTAVWGFASSSLTALTNLSLDTVSCMRYFPRMLMIAISILFVWLSFEKRSKVLYFLIFAAFLNVAVSALLWLLSSLSLHQMSFVGYGLVFAAILCTVYEIRKCPQVGICTKAVSVILLCLVFLLTLISSTQNTSVYRQIALVAVMIFYFVLLGGVIHKFADNFHAVATLTQELEKYETISTKDKLTGLGNRLAFDNKVSQVEALPPQHDAVLFMMDLNGLKEANDTFGHASGDALIATAADCIREAFNGYGESFRIGGDEFAAIIIDSPISPEDAAKNLQKVLDKRNCNESTKVSIAIGYSCLLDDKGIKRSISDWKREADLNMYGDKDKYQQRVSRRDIQELHNIVGQLSMMLEARSPYVVHHSRRVSDISVIIAKNLGLSSKEVSDLQIAAQLHDVGTVTLPESLISKSEPLTEYEFATLKKHPAIGAALISGSGSMTSIADIVLHHHERYDGTGYPDRLSGENIHIGSRIIAVAGSIDAMMTDRCFRGTMAEEDCKEQITSNNGTMFDPAVVKAALCCWDEIKVVLEGCPDETLDESFT